jgi:RNA polymerase sigma-70 factor (ECF subfamily)
MQDDATLLGLIAQGRTEALSELYDRYNRLVFRIAVAIIGDQATATEITLDVFTHVWQRADSYRAERAKVSTWLTIITRNRAIDTLRRRKVRPEANSVSWEELPPRAAAAPQLYTHDLEEQVESSLQRQRILAAVAQLPEEQQQVLALAFFKGYTHSQIAESLGQPLGTVKTRIRLAMQKLRTLLEEEWPIYKTDHSSTAYYRDEDS